MTPRAKSPQLYLFPVRNLLGVAIAPFHRHVRVGVGVDEHVECTGAVELGEEGHGGGDLPEYGLDFALDFEVGFWRGGWGLGGAGLGLVEGGV